MTSPAGGWAYVNGALLRKDRDPRIPGQIIVAEDSRNDTFNRANSTTSLGIPSDGGFPWVIGQGTWGIISNRAYSVTFQDNDYITLPMNNASTTASARFYNVGTGKWPGLVAQNSVGDRYLATVEQATGAVFLYRQKTGVLTKVASTANLVYVDGNLLTLSVYVDTASVELQILNNGVAVASFSDTNVSRITNATNFGIYFGVSSPSGSALQSDDFTADPTIPPDTGTPLIPELPWAMPSRQTMKNSTKKVIAYHHTLPPYWRSGATLFTSVISPSDTGYQQVGGRWRQTIYPLNNETNLTDAMRVQYWLADLTKAANIGIDGFTANVISSMFGSETWRWTEHILPLYQAADDFTANNAAGFTVSPNLSMLSLAGESASTWADRLGNSGVLNRPCTERWSDGRPMIYLYNVDNEPYTWYQTFADRLSTAHGIDVALVPSHQSQTPTGGSLSMDTYLPLFNNGTFVMLHSWSVPSYSASPSTIYSSYRTWCKNNGNIPFMCGAGPAWENDRPGTNANPQLKEKEGKGVTIIQNSWLSAIQADAGVGDPYIQIVSWSDHEESHNIRPSTGYQFVPYDVTSYYLAWFKTGKAPTITRDAVYYAHRMHLSTATYDHTAQPGGSFNTAGMLDQIITTSFLTGPADVTVTTGTGPHVHSHTTGGVFTDVDALTVNNTFSFKITRSGVDVVPSFQSAFPTRGAGATPNVKWQDLLYRMGSSTRAAISTVQNNLPQDRP